MRYRNSGTLMICPGCVLMVICIHVTHVSGFPGGVTDVGPPLEQSVDVKLAQLERLGLSKVDFLEATRLVVDRTAARMDRRTVPTYYNDGFLQRARAAGTGVDAFVFKNDNSSISTRFINFAPTTNVDPMGSGNSGMGTFMADEVLNLGNGFEPGDSITGYELFLARGARDPNGDQPATIIVELWDGDPLGVVDALGGGFTNQPIPGTRSVFSDVPVGAAGFFKGVLVNPVVINRDKFWVVVTGDGCQVGWNWTFLQPEIGEVDADLDSWIEVSDLSGVGDCCDGNGVCDLTINPPMQCLDAEGNPLDSLCSDGDAETMNLFSFGGPCNGDPTRDFCSTFALNIFAEAERVVSLIPVGTGPHGQLDPGVSITGDEIVMATGGRKVFLEARTTPVDPDGLGVTLRYFTLALDTAGFTSGDAGVLSPAFVPCDPTGDSSECVAVFGGECSISGVPCSVDADCPSVDATEVCRGSVCDQVDLNGAPVCQPGVVHTLRDDYILDNNTLLANAFSFDGVGIWLGGAVAGSVPDANPFPEGGGYAGTIALEIPVGAQGTFTIGFRQPPFSLFFDAEDNFMPMFALVPAKITVLCSQPEALTPPTDLRDAIITGRYLAMVPGNAGMETALRVTFVDVPPPYAALNGKSMWVGPPREVSMVPPLTDQTAPTFTAAELQCEPFAMDWGDVDLLHVYHHNIIPGGMYQVQAVASACDTVIDEAAFSSPLAIATAKFGDVGGEFVQSLGFWAPPDGRSDIIDIVQTMRSRGGFLTAPMKVRADFEPSTPDFVVSIHDILGALWGFKGRPSTSITEPEICPDRRR